MVSGENTAKFQTETLPSKTIFLTQPFGRNYAIRHYLQTRGIAVNPHTESQVDYLISEYQARMPIIWVVRRLLSCVQEKSVFQDSLISSSVSNRLTLRSAI